MLWILGLATLMQPPRQVEAVQQAGASSESVYSSEEVFDARYDAIAELRAQGEFARAAEQMKTLLADFAKAREARTRDAEGESRWLVTRALHANLLRDLNRNQEAIRVHEELLRETEGRESLAGRMLHLELLQNYGLALANAGQREEAFAKLREAISQHKELTDEFPDDFDVRLKAAIAGSNFGTLLVRSGELREAVRVFEDAITSVRELPEDRDARNRRLSVLCLNQAVALSYLGDHLRARERVEECLQLKGKLGEVDSQQAIQAQITLGAILGRLNQFQESDQAYADAIKQLRERYPQEAYPNGTADLAIALDNRGVSLSRLGKYTEAAERATEANRMFAALAAQSPGLRLHYARSSASLALLNARLLRHDIAIDNLAAAIETYETMFPEGHFELPGLYRSQAIILSEMRKEAESLASIERALKLGREQFPEDEFPQGHWIVAQSLDTAGTVALVAGRPQLAADYYRDAVEMQQNIARQVLSYVSEAEALQFLAIADEFKSRLLSVPADDDAVYRLLAAEKSRILDQQKQRVALARKSRDPEWIKLTARYEQVRGALAKAVLNPRATGAPEQRAALLKMREHLERQIAEASRNHGGPSWMPPRQEASGIVDQTLAQLDDQTVAIEFFSYEHHARNDQGEVRRTEGEQRLAAFLLDGVNQRVRRIELGPVMPLRRDVRRLTAAMQFGTEAEPLAAVSNRLCSRLLSAIPPTCRRVAIIPDGIVGGIPFSGLLDPTTRKPLIERFEFRFCTSLDAALRQPPRITPEASVLAVGDIDYGPADPANPLEFRPLPGSGLELQQLQKRFADGNTTLLRGDQVNADALISRLPENGVIHLATHGYVTDFARQAVTNNSLQSGAIRRTADQRAPLLATRLALSGANRASPESIVTGEKFAAVDLTQSRLVVLSACESGVGERVLGEGVFGLQRAFHIAGARHVVATLWPVSDQDAVRLMDQFYAALLERNCTPAEALRQAQLTLIEQPTRPSEPAASEWVRRGIRFDAGAAEEKALSRQEQAKATAPQSKASTAQTPRYSARSTWAAFFLSVD
jgi:CHAT domain-containing protein